MGLHAPLVEEIEKHYLRDDIPDFASGDTVKVIVKVTEGSKQRLQTYEGVVIARKNRGLNSSFTVRRISNGEGIERVFPLHSPIISSIEVVRRGEVRRAKLYYLRDRKGKAARIKEKIVKSNKSSKKKPSIQPVAVEQVPVAAEKTQG